jgi:membrane protein
MSFFKSPDIGWWAVFKGAGSDFSNHAMSTYAAALAYRVLFSLFPFLIFLIALVGFLQVPQLFDWLRDQAALLLPGQAMEQVNRVIGELQTPRGGLLSVGAVLALWSASAGVLSLMEALNVAYDVDERRPVWKRYVLAVVYTVGLAALMIAAAALMILGPELAGWIAGKIGLEQVFVTLWNWLRWPAAALLLMLAVSLVYYLLPNARQRFRYITPGAVLSVLIWIAASVGFGLYVSNFANYSATYGSIGAIVILLFYFYLSASVLLLGAEINAVIESQAATNPQRRQTTGDRRRAETTPLHDNRPRYAADGR